jgi:exonuclease III
MADNNLKLLNWNVRGLNCAARREAVKIMIQQAQPNVVCLQETKLDVIDRFLALEFLGQFCTEFQYLPADSTRGGVLIAWNPDLFMGTAPVRNTYSLSLHLTMRMTNMSFIITSVYGPTEDSRKITFLNELVHCQPARNFPWLCLGDFNLIYEAQDKNNSNINRRLMGLFKRALDQSELIEI